MSERTRVVVAGSTGSVGTQALDLVASDPERFEVAALGAAQSVDLLAEQAERFRPRIVALADPARAAELAAALPPGTELRTGPDSLESIAADAAADVVLNGVVGFAGLGVTLQTLAAGRRLALANKESLIAAAPLVEQVRTTPGAEILPVDSEHCAIHQCLAGAAISGRASVRRLVITASGGPFRGRSRSDLASVSVSEALAHPTWSMGPKITIDSSTLMNKGLEVMEANALFGLGIDRIDVVVHPQSIVHSMVEFTDGATIAQLSNPDMRLPIGYCLAYPDRITHSYGAMDWTATTCLEFERPDIETFACLRLAFEAGAEGGAAPAWLSAANEVAVAAFLEGRIGWLQIADVVEESLGGFEQTELSSVADVLAVDAEARARATVAVAARGAAA